MGIPLGHQLNYKPNKKYYLYVLLIDSKIIGTFGIKEIDSLS